MFSWLRKLNPWKRVVDERDILRWGRRALGYGILLCVLPMVLHIGLKMARPKLAHGLADINLLLILCGILVVIKAIRGMAFRERIEAGVRAHPTEPWFADYPWDPAGTSDEITAAIWRLVRLGGIVLIMTISSDREIWAEGTAPFTDSYLITVVVGNLVSVGVVVYLIFQFARLNKFGVPRLRYEKYPYFLGESMNAVWVVDKEISQFTRLEFTLRCVRERWIQVAQNLPPHCVGDICWRDKLVFDKPGELRHQAEVRVTFSLPNDAGFSTYLADHPAQYWELVIDATTPGIPYRSRFLLPAYAQTPPAPTNRATPPPLPTSR